MDKEADERMVGLEIDSEEEENTGPMMRSRSKNRTSTSPTPGSGSGSGSGDSSSTRPKIGKPSYTATVGFGGVTKTKAAPSATKNQPLAKKPSLSNKKKPTTTEPSKPSPLAPAFTTYLSASSSPGPFSSYPFPGGGTPYKPPSVPHPIGAQKNAYGSLASFTFGDIIAPVHNVAFAEHVSPRIRSGSRTYRVNHNTSVTSKRRPMIVVALQAHFMTCLTMFTWGGTGLRKFAADLPYLAELVTVQWEGSSAPVDREAQDWVLLTREPVKEGGGCAFSAPVCVAYNERPEVVNAFVPESAEELRRRYGRFVDEALDRDLLALRRTLDERARLGAVYPR